MVSVASLLNPVPDERYTMLSPCSSRASPEFKLLPAPPHKKQKMTKDAAVFIRGKIQGEVRYPPFEDYDPKTAFELRRFSLHPYGKIREFRRHIPYNSDKKSFLEKTGRGAFEVFQYVFKLPGEEKQHNVMWDYNIGLVRITPFFKCCGYAKTVPAKMLNANPGLREICHSITGGALAAQGYWMPFEAAKAMAATFCFQIRYALVPIFGPDFITECVDPGSDGFGQMIIDPCIVQKCTREARMYREISSRECTQAPRTPTTPEFRSGDMSSWLNKRHRPTHQSHHRHCASMEGGYCTEMDREDICLPSPQSILAHASSVQPQSKSTIGPTSVPSLSETPNSPTLDTPLDSIPPSSQDSSDSEISPRTRKRELIASGRGANEHGTMVKELENKADAIQSTTPVGATPLTSTRDTRAAYVLMQLHFADTSLKDNQGHSPPVTRKRRASN